MAAFARLAENAVITNPITRPRAARGNRSAMIAMLIDPMTPPNTPVTVRAPSSRAYDGARPQSVVPRTKPA